MVVIAHRLSTIRNADKIVVLQKGDVEEQGTHAELIEKQGLYWELVRRQEEGVQDDPEAYDEIDHSLK